MAEVYFSKQIEKIIDKIDFSHLGKNVAIKVHFGEDKCDTYVNPAIVKKVYSKVISLNKKATLVECNVMYKGRRTESISHIEVAKEHGFDFAPIDILDGEKGNEFIEVNVDGFKAKIGKGLEKYDSMIVISHFKGHMMAGYGGAIKNIGMGLGNRAGKLHMHSNIKPSIINSKCKGCGICYNNCDVKAVEVMNKKAKIDPEKCVGCAMCIAVCPERAVHIPWEGSTSAELQEKMAYYCKAVSRIIDNEIYINVLENITSECDCMNTKQKPFMENIGILYSKDIVAIDKASLDLAGEKFSKINSINKLKQLDFAVYFGLGKKEYSLVKV